LADGRWKCGLCGRVFETWDGLVKHLLYEEAEGVNHEG